MIRLLDIIISLLVIIVGLPFLLFLGLIVFIDVKDSPFFIQKRNGKNLKRFNFIKFRTMISKEDGIDDFTQVKSNDSRITKIGAILRNYSLDEIPQFLNVLLGDMSVVGPRPHPIALDDKFSYLEKYNLRYSIKPGITGLAQVRGFTGETDTEEKMSKRLSSDLEYINRKSTTLYLSIFFSTVFGKFYQKN